MARFSLLDGARFADEASEFVSEALRDLHRCWMENRRDNGMIEVRSFDLEDYPILLPDAGMLDVVGGGADFRVRFVGSGMLRRYPDATGRLFKDVVPTGQFQERTLRILGDVVKSRRAIFHDPVRATYAGLEHLTIESLFVPVTLDGETVGRVLFVSALRFE